MLVNICYVDELTVERLKNVWLNTEKPKHKTGRVLFGWFWCVCMFVWGCLVVFLNAAQIPVLY